MPTLPDDHPFVVAYRARHGRTAPCELSEDSIEAIHAMTAQGEDWFAWAFEPMTEAEEELERLEEEDDE